MNSISIMITIILTVRNEEKYIGKCFESISEFELPSNVDIDIIVVDGCSSDRTRDLVRSFIKKDDRIKLIDNPRITQAAGFNIGLKVSNGDYVLWLGAHSVYPKDYLKIAYETINTTKAEYVGGVLNTLPFNSSYKAQIVQALTVHPFGVGNSRFRIGANEGQADTASYGIFNRKVFEKIGYFDERLIRAQDYEFNQRIINNGGTVWLNPKLVVDYYNQPKLFAFLKKQFFKEAPYNAYMWYLAPYTFSYRHAITGVFAMGVIGGVILSGLITMVKWIFLSVMGFYFFLSIVSSTQQAIRYKKPFHIITLPISFFLYHFSHGLGLLIGIIKLLIGIAPVQKIKEPWPGAGRFRAWPMNNQ